MAESRIIHSPSEELASYLSDFPPALFTQVFYESCELIDQYATAWASDLTGQLGLASDIAARRGATEVRRDRGFDPSFLRALDWILERMREQTGGSPPASRAELRRALLELDPENRRSTDLLDAAGEAYPRVASGALRGEEALFGAARAVLWWHYFDNANPFYAINNRIASLAAVRHLPAEKPIRILEVGAGTGSGTRALLELLTNHGLDRRILKYLVTEPAAFFRRRSQRSLSAEYPELALTFGSLDIDQPWDQQGVEPASFDLVFAVNVFHVAEDLPFALREAQRALISGGWLVAGECIRPHIGDTVGIEMIFRLLSDFNKVRIDPTLRPEAGFLSPESWLALLAATGFTEVALTPDLTKVREIYPRFYTGALCGRRSA